MSTGHRPNPGRQPGKSRHSYTLCDVAWGIVGGGGGGGGGGGTGAPGDGAPEDVEAVDPTFAGFGLVDVGGKTTGCGAEDPTLDLGFAMTCGVWTKEVVEGATGGDVVKAPGWLVLLVLRLSSNSENKIAYTGILIICMDV